MFCCKSKSESKSDKVNFPVDFHENQINPSHYDYITDFAGNIQDAKGCNPTTD